MEQEATVAQAETPAAEAQLAPESSLTPEQALQAAAEEQVVAAEGQEEAIQESSDIASLRAEVEALKEVMESKISGDTIQGLQSALEGVKTSFYEDLEKRHREDEATEAEMRQALDQSHQELATLRSSVESIRRVVRPETGGRRLDPSTIPPPVLQKTYETILTGVFREMLRRYGAVASERIATITDYVRRASSGMEFFEVVGNDRIGASGLAEAIRRNLISAHQIHITFNEFSRRLLMEVPGYQALNLEDLVDTGSREYTTLEVQRMADQTAEMEKNQAQIVTRLNLLEELEKRVDDAVARVESLDESLNDKMAKFEEDTSAAIAKATSSLVEAQIATIAGQLSATEQRLQRLDASVATPAEEALPKPKAKSSARRAASKM